MLGASAIAYALNAWLTTEPGWYTIETSTSYVTWADEFTFNYQLGESGRSATSEKKALVSEYSDAMVEAYNNFTVDGEIDDYNNMYYINQHPNEEIKVDAGLYKAFEKIQNAGSRYIYLAPIYEQYDNIFNCTTTAEAINYDPVENQEVADYYQEAANYCNNPDMIDIELLGNNKIRLKVADDYLAYAREEGIVNYIDFYWMRNAFVIDYVADRLIEEGFTYGQISSADGYYVNLNSEEDSVMNLNLFSYNQSGVIVIGEAKTRGKISAVNLRSFPVSETDSPNFAFSAAGQIRNKYLDVADGKPKAAIESLMMLSHDKGCADILLSTMPIYIADTLDEEKVLALGSDDIYAVYCKDAVIYYNDSEVTIDNLYEHGNIKVTESFVN